MHPQVTVLQTTHIKFSSSPGSYCSGKVTIVGRHPKKANKQIAYFDGVLNCIVSIHARYTPLPPQYPCSCF
jgi:hypothetical protein